MNQSTLSQLLEQCNTEELLTELKRRGALEVKSKVEEIEESIKEERLKALQKANDEQEHAKIIRIFLFMLLICIYVLFMFLACQYLGDIALHYESPF